MYVEGAICYTLKEHSFQLFQEAFLTKIRNFSAVLSCSSPCKIVPPVLLDTFTLREEPTKKAIPKAKGTSIKGTKLETTSELNSKHCWVTNFSWKMQIPAQTFFWCGTFLAYLHLYQLQVPSNKLLVFTWWCSYLKWEGLWSARLILLCICILKPQVYHLSTIFTHSWFFKTVLRSFSILGYHSSNGRSLIILLHFESSIF